MMQKLKDVLLTSLRKGDVVVQWNDHQAMFIVTGIVEESLVFITRRIENNFNRVSPYPDVILDIKIRPISEKETYLM